MKQARDIDAALDSGERVVAFINETYGPEDCAEMLENVKRRALLKNSAHNGNGAQPSVAANAVVINIDDEPEARKRLPYGFWRLFMEEGLRMQYTNRHKMQYKRALEMYVLRASGGAQTRAGMRGFRPRGSCRSDGGSQNNSKSVGLMFALLQFFVDNVQRLMTRADSSLLMRQAREYRADLDAKGWRVEELPKLIGNAGAQWFRRWRQRYNITYQVTGMKLKVPWKKVKRRVRVLLGNIFRLRALGAVPPWHSNALSQCRPKTILV